MYTIRDYNEQVGTCRVELDTLKEIVDEFVEKWSEISNSIEETMDNLDNVPVED